jgi:hypothetical protein
MKRMICEILNIKKMEIQSGVAISKKLKDSALTVPPISER